MLYVILPCLLPEDVPLPAQDYNKLWSTQQRYRLPLVQAGLSRWHIGEIASKIGQLYYNYYSRKSDTSALVEAYAFYDAIRARQYFQGTDESRFTLQQQLRYHARFILVCLLLQEIDKVCLRTLHVSVTEANILLCQIMHVDDYEECNTVRKRGRKRPVTESLIR
jgi:hypothetical protein